MGTRRHDRPPTEAERDQRHKLDMDPLDALRVLLTTPAEPEPDKPED